MNLRETILAEHSRHQADKIISWVGNNQQRFDQLFELVLTDETIISQRGAWPLSDLVIRKPGLIKKHLPALLKKLEQKDLHNAITRNGVRVLAVLNTPPKLHGRVMNLCFDYVVDPMEKPAIKANALTVLQNLAKQYPEIRNELRLIIQSQWEHESAAFRSRAAKILKGLESSSPGIPKDYK